MPYLNEPRLSGDVLFIKWFDVNLHHLLLPHQLATGRVLFDYINSLRPRGFTMAANIRTSELHEPIDVAEYLFRRLHEVGVRAVHGVPGDYNLVALDYLPKAGLDWVGNVNELNAGIRHFPLPCVDVVAHWLHHRLCCRRICKSQRDCGHNNDVRCRRTFSDQCIGWCLLGICAGCAHRGHTFDYITTRWHALASHIRASLSVEAMSRHITDNSSSNGDFNVFSNMSKEISCFMAKLNDPHEAAMLIDSAIRECWIRSRPVYIMLPTDIVQKKVEGKRLQTPIDLSFQENDPEKEDYVVDVVLKYLHAAKNPVILVDACAIRHRALDEVHALVEKSGLPTFVAPMGKGAIDETLPTFGGVYAGDGSLKGVKERVESADLVLSIGAIKSDFNTAGFTYRVSQLTTIDFHSDYIRVKYSEYPGVRMNGVLKKVTEKMGKLNVQAGPQADNDIAEEEQDMSKDQIITQAWFWPRMGQWLQENDIVITETGTANFGIWVTRFPKGVTALSQVLWGSIGYSVGACQGAALAAKETGDRRTVLFVGDGSFELTAQEVSTMIRHGLKPIM